MKRNFNRPVMNYSGKPLIGEDQKQQSMGNLIAMQLYSVGINDGATPEKKLQAYKLLNKLAGANKEIEITTEEGALIKEVAGRVFAAGLYGQIYDFIENG